MKRGRALADWARGHRLLTAILAFELLIMLVFGLYTARNFKVYSPVDEGAHFDYVQTIAEDLTLPTIHDRIHDEVLSIAEGTYPDPPIPPVKQRHGLDVHSYEAFQPPLYYVVAAPVFSIPVDNVAKLHLLRVFGLMLLLAALVPFGLLCRELVGDRWPTALAFGGLIFVLPSVLERAVLINNVALEVPMGALFAWLVVRAHKRDSLRWFAAAGAALGLCLLTKLTLVFLVPVFLLALAVHARRKRTWQHISRVVGVAVIPLLLLAPWFAWNLDQYGTLTANEQAQAMQRATVNPTDIDYHLDGALETVPSLLDFSLPQEWGHESNQPFRELLRWFLVSVLFLIPLAIGHRLWTRERAVGTLLLALPLFLGIAALVVFTVRSDFFLLVPRYLHGALPAWGAMAFVAWESAVINERVLHRVSIAALVAIFCLWMGYAQTFL